MNGMERCFFFKDLFIFGVFFFNTIVMDDDGNGEYIFNTFCTNLHLASIQMHSIQLDLNSIELKLNLNFNSIQIACNVMQHFHSNGT